MKRIRCIFTILFLLLLLSSGGIEILAMNTGFDTQPLPKDKINTFLNNVNISVLTEEPPKRAIECFDVNENGIIAIGSSNFNEKSICVYTNDGIFQYGYSFKCEGSFGIEMDEDILNIYFVRSDVAVAINSEGEIESILQIKNTIENNDYWNHSVNATKRTIGNTEYNLKNDMGIFNLFASSYSQLTMTNEGGGVDIIYDVNQTQLTSMVIKFISALAFICFVSAVVIGQFIKTKRNF